MNSHKKTPTAIKPKFKRTAARSCHARRSVKRRIRTRRKKLCTLKTYDFCTRIKYFCTFSDLHSSSSPTKSVQASSKSIQTGKLAKSPKSSENTGKRSPTRSAKYMSVKQTTTKCAMMARCVRIVPRKYKQKPQFI